MSQPTRPAFLDLVPGFPEKVPFTTAIVKWWKETYYFIGHTWTPSKPFLPEPAKRLALPDPKNLTFQGGEPSATTLAYVGSVREFVKAAEARLTTIRTKGSGLLGFVTLVTPLFAWWLVSGRDRLVGTPFALSVIANVLGIAAAVFLALAVRAFLRTQAVVGYESETPDIFVDADAGTFKPYDLCLEINILLRKWGCIHRWSDVLADHFRAGQRFLAIALSLTIAAGLPAYFYPGSTKASQDVIAVKPTHAQHPVDPQSSLERVAVVCLVLVTLSFLAVLCGMQILVCMFYWRMYGLGSRHIQLYDDKTSSTRTE